MVSLMDGEEAKRGEGGGGGGGMVVAWWWYGRDGGDASRVQGLKYAGSYFTVHRRYWFLCDVGGTTMGQWC